jgi:hypothetical protein
MLGFHIVSAEEGVDLLAHHGTAVIDGHAIVCFSIESYVEEGLLAGLSWGFVSLVRLWGLRGCIDLGGRFLCESVFGSLRLGWCSPGLIAG